MLYYSLWLPVFLALAFAMARLRFERRSILTVLAALVLYYFHIYNTNWGQFAIDHGPHTTYVEYLVHKRHLPPLGYLGVNKAAFRHPPPYYIVSALIYTLAQHTDRILPMYAVRHWSLALYLTFIVFAALTLRRFAPEKSEAFQAGLLMLAFWPVGVTMGGRITSDLPLYAAEAACLYGLVRFAQERDARALSVAFIASGFALLAKNTGMLFLALNMACLLYGVWRQGFRAYAARRLLLSMAFAFACALFAVQWGWLFSSVPEQVYQRNWPPLAEILRSNLWFDLPLFFDESIYNVLQPPTDTLFWNTFLRSLLLGRFFEWRLLSVVYALGVVWICLLVYILISAGQLFRAEAGERRAFLLLLAASAPMLGSLMGMHLLAGNPAFFDARYIYPVLIPVLAAFVLAMRGHAQAGNRVAVSIGNGFALSLALLSVILFAGQYTRALL